MAQITHAKAFDLLLELIENEVYELNESKHALNLVHGALKMLWIQDKIGCYAIHQHDVQDKHLVDVLVIDLTTRGKTEQRILYRQKS